MVETMGRIRRSYPADAAPPPVEKVGELIESGDFARIREDFGSLWKELMDHHRASGEELHPRVAHNFRIIDTLVRSL